jgi:hypothetical protein
MRVDEAIKKFGKGVWLRLPKCTSHMRIDRMGHFVWFHSNGYEGYNVSADDLLRDDWEVYKLEPNMDYLTKVRVPPIGGGAEHRRDGLDFIGIGPDGKGVYAPCPIRRAVLKERIEKLKKNTAESKSGRCGACQRRIELSNRTEHLIAATSTERDMLFLLKQACTCDKEA